MHESQGTRMSQSKQPGTPSLLRAINDRAALELLLEQGPLTRARLGELTGLSKVTASQLIERLEDRGLVARVGETSVGRGPNAALYAVDPTYAYVIGVEVGPSQVVAASADITGATTARVEVYPHDSDDPAGVVHNAVLETADKAGAPWEKVRRIVLGTPGLVDPATGDIAFAFDLPQWHRGLLGTLRADLKRPVTFENDVNLAAVAEASSGAARGIEDFVLVWIGRGVGLAVVLGGRLHRGAAGAAGEIGYLPVPGAPVADDARTFKPGGLTGSFQRTVGAETVRSLARARGFRGATAADAVSAAIEAGEEGEPVLDELARRVAIGVASVCVVLDPSLVVLSGEVGRAGGDALARRVRAEVARIAPVSPRVVPTGIGTDAVLSGALLTGLSAAREEVFSEMHD
jgi:predicted NBD/HSP70 family sugar kinase